MNQNYNPPPFPPPWPNPPYPQPPKENWGKEIGKTVGIQMAIMLTFQTLLTLGCMVSGDQNDFIAWDMLFLLLHWGIMFILMIIAFVRSKPAQGVGYILSIIVGAITGFGSCVLIADTIGARLF